MSSIAAPPCKSNSRATCDMALTRSLWPPVHHVRAAAARARAGLAEGLAPPREICVRLGLQGR